MNNTTNLLTITDTSLVDRINKTKNFKLNGCYSDEVVSYPVYKVRLDLLHYNLNDYHIASDVASYELKHGSLEELHKTQGTDTYNAVMDDIFGSGRNVWLENKMGEIRTPDIFHDNEDMLSYDEEDDLLYAMSQGYTAITLSNGCVLDGNFRLLKLRKLQEKIGKPLYMNTIILDVEAEPALIKTLEKKIVYEGFNYYPCEKCSHSDASASYWFYECEDCKYFYCYDLIDKAMGEHRAMEEGELIPDEDDDINRARRMYADLSKIYIDILDYMGRSGDYAFLKENGIGYTIQYRKHLFRNIEPVRNEKNVVIYNIIIMNALDECAMKDGELEELLYDDICKEYYLKQQDITKELQSRYANADIKTIEEFNTFLENCADLRDMTIKNLQDSHNHYYRTILSNITVTDCEIDELELSVRAHNCLRRAGITSVAELIKMSEEELKKVRNLGPKSLREVMKTIEIIKEINGMT